MLNTYFTWKWLSLSLLVFVSVLLLTHFGLRELRYEVFFDMDQYWPISLVRPKYPLWQDVITLAAIGTGWVLFLRWWREGKPLVWFVGLAGLLIMATNLLQGYEYGLVTPLVGLGDHDHQYWQDVEKLRGGVVNFVESYEWLQPTLHIHSRVHPPGPVMFFYWARSIVARPDIISLLVLVVSLSSAWFLYQILKAYISEAYAKLGAMLLLLLPAVQIYFLTTIDALICALFIATFWAWQKADNVTWLLVSGLCLFLSLWLTFGAVFLLPVLLYENWRLKRNSSAIFKLFGLVGLILLIINQVLEYNYLSSFQLAASFEGPKGFYGFAYPLSYVVTRIEDVFELMVFFGPFLTVIFGMYLWQWWKKKNWREFALVGVVALATLLAFFIAGGYYTGETARAALYIYPFLLIPIAWMADKEKLSVRNQQVLMSLIFGQAVLMQSFGYFVW